MSHLAVGASAGALGLGAAGCAGAPLRPELGAAEAVELVGRLERGLAAVRSADVGLREAAPWQLRPERAENVIKLGMEALVVADVARSVPSNVRVPTLLAERLQPELPTLARCATSYHALLSQTPPAVRRNVDRQLRNAPDTAMQLAEWIDARAATTGVGGESRVRLRQLATHVTARVRRQSTDALIDDTVAKIGLVFERSGASMALARSVTTDALGASLWQQVEGQGGSPPGLYQPPPEPQVPEEMSPGEPELITGGVMLGAGLGVFGIGTAIGAAIGGAGAAMLVLATPCGVAVIIGIILLIIGGVQNA